MKESGRLDFNLFLVAGLLIEFVVKIFLSIPVLMNKFQCNRRQLSERTVVGQFDVRLSKTSILP